MTDKIIQAKVQQITPLTESIIRLVLEPEHYQPYQAGQYLNIIVGSEELSFSIANAPLGAHQYELHIRHNPHFSNSVELFKGIQTSGAVQIKLPFGTCSIDKIDANKPIIFIAGGTGFAQTKAFIEYLLANDDPRPFELYWGARSQADLYLEEQVKTWALHVQRFYYYPIISDSKQDNLASKVIGKHKKDIFQWQIILSGPFDMVYSARDLLLHHGVSKNNLYSDAFQFES